MKTDKKNQHYIPKFYLRNFSYKSNQKEIGLFNTGRNFFIQRGPLKSQASKNFYYGEDGVLENWLSEVEGELATCIRNILESKILPNKGSKDHIDLIAFAAITDLRNPVSIDAIMERNEIMKRKLLELDPYADTSKFVPDTSHEQNVKLSLSNIDGVIRLCSDLEFKLIINRTDTSFITSDVPVVRYNQFLERNNWPHGKTGFGAIGLQIIIPLNPRISIFFYDPQIYNVGNKQNNYLEINREDDIDQLNLLQILNCRNNLFFNEDIAEEYVSDLVLLSKQFEKANIPFGNMHDLHGRSDKSLLLIMGETECEINLKIKGVNVHSGASKVKFTDSVVMVRPHAIRMREFEKNLLRQRYKK